MSATAVSNAIAGLETRLDARLFNRTTRSVALTEAGQRFVARIGPALQEIQQAADEIHSQPDEPSGTLRINVPQAIGQLFLDELVIAFLSRYPQMRMETASDARMIDIVAEGYDAGVRLAEAVPQDMIAVPLTPDIHMRVVATPQWFAEHGTPLTPEALTRQQGICMRMSHGGFIAGNLRVTANNLPLPCRRDLPPPICLHPLPRYAPGSASVFCRNYILQMIYVQAGWSVCSMSGHSPFKDCVCITPVIAISRWVCRRLSPLSASTGSTHCNPARSRL
jgi:DNA-binding transcriptional LysR family regulator